MQKNEPNKQKVCFKNSGIMSLVMSKCGLSIKSRLLREDSEAKSRSCAVRNLHELMLR